MVEGNASVRPCVVAVVEPGRREEWERLLSLCDLEDAGMEALLCCDAAALGRTLETRTVAVILLELEVDYLEPVEFLAELRREGRDATVVVVGDRLENETMFELSKAGARKVLIRPLDIEVLREFLLSVADRVRGGEERPGR